MIKNKNPSRKPGVTIYLTSDEEKFLFKHIPIGAKKSSFCRELLLKSVLQYNKKFIKRSYK